MRLEIQKKQQMMMMRRRRRRRRRRKKKHSPALDGAHFLERLGKTVQDLKLHSVPYLKLALSNFALLYG